MKNWTPVSQYKSIPLHKDSVFTFQLKIYFLEYSTIKTCDLICDLLSTLLGLTLVGLFDTFKDLNLSSHV